MAVASIVTGAIAGVAAYAIADSMEKNATKTTPVKVEEKEKTKTKVKTPVKEKVRLYAT